MGLGVGESVFVLLLIFVQLVFLGAVLLAVVRIFQIHRDVREMKATLSELMTGVAKEAGRGPAADEASAPRSG
jgi:hypothetical protein